MSELIEDLGRQTLVRKKLLMTVSTFALAGYVSLSSGARAEDQSHPTVWIELGGQLEMMQGLSSPFTAPFMFPDPVPTVYGTSSFIKDQRPVRSAFGLEGQLIFQPSQTDWRFTVGVRYGRSQAKRETRHQSAAPGVTILLSSVPHYTRNYDIEMARAVSAPSRESHLLLDFSVGKDIGIGAFGHDGRSSIGGGIRLMSVSENSTINIFGRPTVKYALAPPKYLFPYTTIPRQYTMTAHSQRSFVGLGPSLSWNASAGILGNKEGGELTLDWGVNAALLFGRQKAKTDHKTVGYYKTKYAHGLYTLPAYSPPHSHHSTRSRRATVPNLGGFVGLSMKYPNAKISLGYRADFFFGAIDAGIDERQTKNLGFNGPFATISLGLGG